MKLVKVMLMFLLISVVSLPAVLANNFIAIPRTQTKIFYEIDPHWQIIDYGTDNNFIKKLFIRSLSKQYCLDDVPSMLVQVESTKAKDMINPVDYYIVSMTRLPKIKAYNNKIFSFSDNLVKIKSVIGVYGPSTLTNHKKVVMSNITFTFGTKGVKIILMCPIKYFNSIQREFLNFLSSIKIVTDEIVPEIQEGKDNNAIYLRYEDIGIVKYTID